MSSRDVVAGKTHGHNHFGQKLPGAADERDALQILIVTGSLADKHDFCLFTSDAKDDIFAVGMELTPFTITQFSSDFRKELGFAEYRFRKVRWQPLDSLLFLAVHVFLQRVENLLHFLR